MITNSKPRVCGVCIERHPRSECPVLTGKIDKHKRVAERLAKGIIIPNEVAAIILPLMDDQRELFERILREEYPE